MCRNTRACQLAPCLFLLQQFLFEVSHAQLLCRILMNIVFAMLHLDKFDVFEQSVCNCTSTNMTLVLVCYTLSKQARDFCCAFKRSEHNVLQNTGSHTLSDAQRE